MLLVKLIASQLCTGKSGKGLGWGPAGLMPLPGLEIGKESLKLIFNYPRTSILPISALDPKNVIQS